MVHGSPWPPYGQYLVPTNPLFRRCDQLDADVIVTGHTHLPFHRRFGRTLVINPGAAGAARFKLEPSVALLSLPDRRVRIVRLGRV